MLSSKQLEFFQTKARLSALVGGIGSGKSHVGVTRDIDFSLRWTRSLGVILGPTNQNLKDTTTRKFFELCPPEAIKDFNRSERHLIFNHPNDTVSVAGSRVVPADGSEILFRGADDDRVVDRLRGLELAWFHIDEAALCPPMLLDVLVGRLRQKGYRHAGWMTSTHKGKDWLYRRFEPDDREIKPVGPIWHTSVYDNAANLPEGYISTLEAMYKGEWAKQELMGLHAKFEGLVYPEFDRVTHVVHGDLPKFYRMIFGVDWGYHYAPILVLGLNDRDQWVVAEEWYGHMVTLDDQIIAANAIRNKYQGNMFYCDRSRPENILAFNRGGLWAPEFEQGKVDEGILEVTRLLAKRPDGRPGLLIHESCTSTISEIESYMLAKRSGRDEDDPTLYKPVPAEGQMDHAMDAMRYALMGGRMGQVYSGVVEPDPYYTIERSTTGLTDGRSRLNRRIFR